MHHFLVALGEGLSVCGKNRYKPTKEEQNDEILKTLTKYILLSNMPALLLGSDRRSSGLRQRTRIPASWIMMTIETSPSPRFKWIQRLPGLSSSQPMPNGSCVRVPLGCSRINARSRRNSSLTAISSKRDARLHQARSAANSPATAMFLSSQPAASSRESEWYFRW